MCKRTSCLAVLTVALVMCCCASPSPDEDTDNQETTFIENLPSVVRSNIVWHCDYEDGTYQKWEDEGTHDYYSGGGIFVTDSANSTYGITEELSKSGSKSGYATIENATTPGEKKAVRFMRWTDKAWNDDGEYFPDQAYYSVFMYFAAKYDPTKDPDNDPNNDGGWWNLFQFKARNSAGSQPIVALDLYYENDGMYIGLSIKDYPDDNSDDYTQTYVKQTSPTEIEANSWVHFEVYYEKTKEYAGKVIVWQNGQQIFEEDGIRTLLPQAETATWGVGNYTDYINGGNEAGTATIYYDDAIVATTGISQHL